MAPKARNPGPQVKDSDTYEALRDQGASKEKAARIANAAAKSGRSEIGKRGGEAESYEQWTVQALKRRARELGLSGYSALRKRQLIDALRSH